MNSSGLSVKSVVYKQNIFLKVISILHEEGNIKPIAIQFENKI